MTFKENSRLPLHEWAAVLTIAALFASILMISYKGKPPLVPPEFTDSLVVRVIGDVEKPGYYTLPQGSKVKDLISAAGPRSDTEPVGLGYTSPLKDGQTVRFKNCLVKVKIKGAVLEPKTHLMRKGAFLSDYARYLELAEDADLSKVASRQIRRQNQTITIPRKKG